MDDPFIYGLLLFLLFLFLTLKSAFSSINKLQLELDKKKANYHSKILNFISKKTSEFSTSINISYFITLTILIFIIKEDLNFLCQSLNQFLFLLIFSLSIGLLIFPAFKIIPKTCGEYFSNEIINFSAIPLIIIYILLFPITKILLFSSNTIIKIFYKGSIKVIQKKDFDMDDLNKLFSDNQKHRSQNEEMDAEIKLFKNALEFSDIKLRECMIPRTEIIAVELNDINKDLKTKFISSGYSKILIYSESIENIIGYIKSKSLFLSNNDFKNKIRDIKFFPESMPADKLLKYFIRAGQNIAVVVDEFGGTSGIITIEDILEEIFGEIKDEHDTVNLFEKKITEKDYVFSGRLEIDYINEKYNLRIPVHEEYETVAGFILNHTENFPKINDRIIIETFSFTILKVSETRVELIKLEILSE